MARTMKKKEVVKETATVVTRAEKKDATKNLIREILAVNPNKHNELIDEVAKLYVERFGDETDNINDVKGRVGSVLDIMKKESDVMYEGGMYALKARMPMSEPTSTEPKEKIVEEKPAPKKRGRKPKAKVEETAIQKETKIVEESPSVLPEVNQLPKEENQALEEKAEPLPPAPLQPIAPTAPITPEVAPEPIPADKPAPKKRGRKPKAKVVEVEQIKLTPAVSLDPQQLPQEENEPPMVEVKEEEPAKTEETVVPMIDSAPAGLTEEVKEEPKAEAEKAEPKQLVVKEKAELAKPVMDMSFLFGDVKSLKTPKSEEKKDPLKEEKKSDPTAKEKVAQTTQKTVKKPETKSETPAPKANKPIPKVENRLVEKSTESSLDLPTTRQISRSESQDKAPRVQTNVRKLPQGTTVRSRKASEKPLTADEKLREAFLKKIRSLGGDYFEYYSVYLLERYSMKNGRRLESMKISGGDHDGGIDGEIELTDKLGFKETIYIQSKNWNPEKGDEKLWVVGETLLQQFIGACACRQAKEGKQNCRGIFITTSRFTPEAKHILDDLSDKIVGYDGNDLYDAAKECSFGLIQKNGEWVLDERLLSGNKAFFNLY